MSFAGFGRSRIPFQMFDLEESASEARRSAKLGNLYHRGQELAWDGRAVLKKLLGMQLMIETLALTIFQAVRDTRIEPVLADLLRYYEKDEARHVGLGIQMLPGMMKKMSRREGLGLFAFQIEIIGWSIAGLKS